MYEDRNGIIGRIDGDRIVRYALIAIASITVLMIVSIIAFIFANSTKAIGDIGIIDFLTGVNWAPLSGEYGSLPLIAGTVLVTIGAMVISIPLGLGAAIYISEMAPERIKAPLKSICEIFAGIPSVVYGFFGLVVLVPFLRQTFPDNLLFGSSWLAGSILLGIMALPTIISVSEDALRAVPRSYREASLAMGATRWDTIRNVVIPAATSGIVAAVMLGVGRAIGETMAVMMVTGNSAIFPEPIWNIFSLVRTLTASLALEMPEVVAGSTHQSALFLLALILMIMVLAINLAAKYVIKRSKIRMGTIDAKRRSLIGIGPHAKRTVRKILMAACIFLFSSAMISLLTAPWIALVSGFALTCAYVAVSSCSRKIGPNTRERTATASMTAVMIAVCAILVIIIGDIVVKGIPAISWDFLTAYPSDGGRSGGIYPAIVGTLKLIAGTLVIALPIGIATGVYLSEYAGNSRITGHIRSAIDILSGTPSIVFGLFGMAAFVIYFGWNYSLIGGCITLAMMIVPTIIRTTEESVSAVPNELREASMAMGATKWQTIVKVVLPAALSGVMTGTILSLGRAAGETAPIMFTAAVAFQGTMSSSIFDPIMALPYHLYYLSAEVPGSETAQYGTALVLLIMVLSMFAAASLIRHRNNKRTRF